MALFRANVLKKVKNRIHAVLHRRAILLGKGSLSSLDGRRLLEQLELDQAGRNIVTRYMTVLDHLKEQISESNSELRKMMLGPRWTKLGGGWRMP